MAITRQEAEREVLENYKAFHTKFLPELLGTNFGEWALMHQQEVEGVYPTMIDAYNMGMKTYTDERFSIQEVRVQEPIDLGWYSHVV